MAQALAKARKATERKQAADDALRQALVEALAVDGVTVRRLAAATGLSKSAVHRIVHRQD